MSAMKMSAIWILVRAFLKMGCIITALPLLAMGALSLMWGNVMSAAVCGVGGFVLLTLGLFVIRVRKA